MWTPQEKFAGKFQRVSVFANNRQSLSAVLPRLAIGAMMNRLAVVFFNAWNIRKVVNQPGCYENRLRRPGRPVIRRCDETARTANHGFDRARLVGNRLILLKVASRNFQKLFGMDPIAAQESVHRTRAFIARA